MALSQREMQRFSTLGRGRFNMPGTWQVAALSQDRR